MSAVETGREMRRLWMDGWIIGWHMQMDWMDGKQMMDEEKLRKVCRGLLVIIMDIIKQIRSY
jgi:hypothetical protein